MFLKRLPDKFEEKTYQMNYLLMNLRFKKIFILLVFALNLWGCSDFTKNHFKTEDQSNLINTKNLAEQGDVEAQYNLAWMYYQGDGVSQDYNQALKWFTQAALKGNARAQFRLSLMYFLGQGTIQDYIMAHMFANIASTNGNENAKIFRNKLAQLMTPEQVNEAQKMAKEWMKRL